MRVVPYVKDTKNALVMRMEPARSGAEMASLQAAFKEAIQKHFQLEPRELSCEPMPSPRDRHEILFYESSEGGAGVLRQIAEDPAVLPALARQALEICHFDPDTLEDKGAQTCGKACYECLLDYGNQPDHKDLDRRLVRDLLSELSKAVCRPAGGAGSRAERMAALRNRCDSQLEKRWLDLVDALMLRPPSDAQFLIECSALAQTSIIASTTPPSTSTARRTTNPIRFARTKKSRRRLMETGYIVIRFHHQGGLNEIFASASGYLRRTTHMSTATLSNPGTLIHARGRDWVVLPESTNELLIARPVGGLDEEVTGILPDIEPVTSASFRMPTHDDLGDFASGQLLREAARLSTRAAAGPFRSFGRIVVEPRPYQLVPLMMALKLDPVRLLIADDVGIGKTIEAAVIARELLDRGEIHRLTVLCPPHLAEQWQQELAEKFHIEAELILSSTIQRLERDLPVGVSVFDRYRFTIVSTDFIKTPRHAEDFILKCPEFVIVDEAHGCTLAGGVGHGRQQRFELLRRVAEDKARHLVLVTATPHSGNEDAFRSLLEPARRGIRQPSHRP